MLIIRKANLISIISFFLFFFLDLSSAKRKFADSLNEFKFQCIGDAETDDEMCIGKSHPHGRQKHSSKPSLELGGLLVRNPVSSGRHR